MIEDEYRFWNNLYNAWQWVDKNMKVCKETARKGNAIKIHTA